jgi:hypothetical protein
MEIHAAASRVTQSMIDQLKQQQVKREPGRPFTDPIREFHRASQVEGTVRNWLTLPLETRRDYVKNLIPCVRYPGEPAKGIAPETEQNFKIRVQERWRALCVIVQEESRADLEKKPDEPMRGSPEIAIVALKHLFPDHNWPKASGK